MDNDIFLVMTTMTFKPKPDQTMTTCLGPYNFVPP